MNDPTGLRLLFLRHGQTDLNRKMLMQGRTDAPLNALGRRQVEASRKRLRGESIDAIYSSDLLRARESAEIVAADLGLPVETDPRLREQDLGDWEGDFWPELPRIYGEASVERFLGDLDFAPPGGESRRQVRDRIRAFTGDLLAGRGPEECVLVVSHGGPLFAFLHDVLDLPYSSRKRFYGANGSLSVFLGDGPGWQMVSFNETWFLGDASRPTDD